MNAASTSPGGGKGSNRWPRYAAAAAGFAWFLRLGGGPTLDPRNYQWLLSGDWLQHWLGWLFFRLEPWRYPLGRIDTLLYPVGTNIGFTDSNPLVSLMLKPFSGVLPEYAQFAGLWLAACFALQGYAGAALASVVARRPWQQFLGGCLFALSPVLTARVGHEALCAHWLLLGVLYLGLREAPPGSGTRTAALAAGATLLAAAIHPYLAAMCWVLAHTVFLRLLLSRALTGPRAAAVMLVTSAGVGGIFAAVGYFGIVQLGQPGFGVYAADMLSLVNPMGHSRFLPDLAVPATRWEGFGYLGLGGIVLALLACVTAVRERPRVSWAAGLVAAVAVAMAVYALSNVVTFNGREVLRYDWRALTITPFRASGRFLWPLHYLLLLAGIRAVVHGLPGRVAWVPTAVLAAAVALQASDVTLGPTSLEAKAFRQARLFNFRLAAGHYRHLALYPAQVMNVTGFAFEEDLVHRYMLLAYKLRMTYNSAMLARVPTREVLDATTRMSAAVARGELDPETIYIVWPALVQGFRERRAVCAPFDGDWVCVGREGHAAFRDFVRESGRNVSPPATTAGSR